MAVHHIQMQAVKQMELPEIHAHLEKELQIEFLCKVERQLDSAKLMLLVGEDIFLRAQGTISLMVLLLEKDGVQTAEVISSGGGEGMSFAFGANRSFAKYCQQALETCGFQNATPEPQKNKLQKMLHFFTD